MHEKYYREIVGKINAQLNQKWPKALACDVNVFDWAVTNQPDLCTRECKLNEEINKAWDLVEFEEFKKIVLSWGRVVLAIFKSFAEARTA